MPCQKARLWCLSISRPRKQFCVSLWVLTMNIMFLITKKFNASKRRQKEQKCTCKIYNVFLLSKTRNCLIINYDMLSERLQYFLLLYFSREYSLRILIKYWSLFLWPLSQRKCRHYSRNMTYKYENCRNIPRIGIPYKYNFLYRYLWIFPILPSFYLLLEDNIFF